MHKCNKCKYSWKGKGTVKTPKSCPSCKSYKWRKPETLDAVISRIIK